MQQGIANNGNQTYNGELGLYVQRNAPNVCLVFAPFRNATVMFSQKPFSDQECLFVLGSHVGSYLQLSSRAGQLGRLAENETRQWSAVTGTFGVCAGSQTRPIVTA